MGERGGSGHQQTSEMISGVRPGSSGIGCTLQVLHLLYKYQYNKQKIGIQDFIYCNFQIFLSPGK